MSAELKDVIDGLGRAFEEFKTANDLQLKELKAGKAEVTLNDKVDKLNTAMDELQAQKDEIEKKLNRPQFDGGDNADQKALDAFNIEIKAHAITQGRAQPADVTAEQFREYKSTFMSVMRKGDKSLSDTERKAMIVGSDSDGGHLVPSDTTGRIITKLRDLSPIRQIANVQVIGSDRLEGIEDLGEDSAGWTSEIGSRTATTTAQIGKWEIVANEMYSMPKASQKLLDDASIDIEAWLIAKIADKMARLEGTAFVAGTGVGQPRGFTTYTTAATADATRSWGTIEHVVTGASGAFHTTQSDPLFDLIAAFKPGYLQGANWVTRRSVIAAVRKFKEISSTSGNYLWQPGLQVGQPATLIGFPVVIAEDMPAMAANSLSMALGNFNVGYQIVDRLGVRIQRDPFTDRPYVLFYTTKRTGGGIVNTEAIKFMKFAA